VRFKELPVENEIVVTKVWVLSAGFGCLWLRQSYMLEGVRKYRFD